MSIPKSVRSVLTSSSSSSYHLYPYVLFHYLVSRSICLRQAVCNCRVHTSFCYRRRYPQRYQLSGYMGVVWCWPPGLTLALAGRPDQKASGSFGDVGIVLFTPLGAPPSPLDALSPGHSELPGNPRSTLAQRGRRRAFSTLWGFEPPFLLILPLLPLSKIQQRKSSVLGDGSAVVVEAWKCDNALWYGTLAVLYTTLHNLSSKVQSEGELPCPPYGLRVDGVVGCYPVIGYQCSATSIKLPYQ